MAYNEKLADRIREALSDVKKVEEKKMFRGMCFMVNKKMCVCVSENEMMCRIGPEKFEEALEMDGCRPMVHNGKTMKGFVFVNEENIRTKKTFDYWLGLALEFNKEAKASKKARPRKAAKRK